MVNFYSFLNPCLSYHNSYCRIETKHLESLICKLPNIFLHLHWCQSCCLVCKLAVKVCGIFSLSYKGMILEVQVQVKAYDGHLNLAHLMIFFRSKRKLQVMKLMDKSVVTLNWVTFVLLHRRKNNFGKTGKLPLKL